MMPAPVVKALVCLMLSAAIPAWAQNAPGSPGKNPSPPTLSGIVSKVGGGQFAVVDKNGEEVACVPAADAAYQLKKAPSTLEEAVKVGSSVKCTLGPDGKVQQVVSKGLVDSMNIKQLKPMLGATDDEWKVLQPQIEKVQLLMDVVDSGTGNGGQNAGQNGAVPTGPGSLQAMLADLRKMYFQQEGTVADMSNQVAQLRKARAQAKSDLAQARKQLTELVGAKQEVLLVMMGILE